MGERRSILSYLALLVSCELKDWVGVVTLRVSAWLSFMKIKMADDSSPAASEKKQPLTDDTKGLSDVGAVEQEEYLVS